MKKIIYTLLATALMLGIGNQTAQANENSSFKLAAQVLVGGQFGESYSQYYAESEEELHPLVLAQRVQFGMLWNARENLDFNMFIRVPGEMTWGNNSGNKAFESLNYMAVKVAHIDWKPSDNLRFIIGRQFFRGPDHVGFVGSPIQQDFTDGIRIMGNVGSNVSYDIIWGRNHAAGIDMTTEYSTNNYESYSYDDLKGRMDIPNYTFEGYSDDPSVSSTLSTSPFNVDWFVYSVLYKNDTVELKPYGALTVIAKDAVTWGSSPRNANFVNLTGDTTYLYWAGLTSKIKLDGLNFGVDAVWNGNQVDYHDGGYLVDAYIRKTMKNFNLNLIGWYANGNKKDQIAGLQQVCFDGVLGHVNSKYLGWGLQPFTVGSGVGIPTGTYGVGFEFANFKPFDDVNLTMNANLTYINGTNHVDFAQTEIVSDTYSGPYNLNNGFASYLTTKDHLVDVGMSFIYFPIPRMYLGLDMNYLMPHMGRDGAKETKNGYHLGITTQFSL